VTDEPKDEKPTEAPRQRTPRAQGPQQWDPRYQRNLAERLFPGPSKSLTEEEVDRIQGLLQSTDAEAWAKVRRDRRDRQTRTATEGDTGRRAEIGKSGTVVPSPEPVNAATSDDISQLRDSIEEQNELLRAILASSVDNQEDARSTAQNSRTFAWAGTAIALLTLVATVIALVAAIRG
jgi:hypothetical protein